MTLRGTTSVSLGVKGRDSPSSPNLTELKTSKDETVKTETNTPTFHSPTVHS